MVFEVAIGATKVDIKRAVEKLLGSKVEGVRTAIAHGKFKRQGRFIGQRSDWKKAYVKLRDGREDSGVPGRARKSSCQLPASSWRSGGCEQLEAGSWKLQGSEDMPIRKYNPTSPGRRFQTVQVFDEVTTSEPYKPLTEPLRKSGGRNNHGELTSWWRGGGHKRNYRIIDFKRDKADIPGHGRRRSSTTRTARRTSRC